ncbi:MAG TPA: ATP-binding cassette domain-containing protein [Rhizomicrobium sp.]|nr:ATP-binding cassette domain-containing protein [Rhizomicrobium sp.]
MHGTAEPSAFPTFTSTDICLERNDAFVAVIPDIKLKPGEVAALVGPSGSGKTTALMAFALIRPPQRGRILIGGTDTARLGPGARDRFRGRHIGLVFQSFHLVDALSVEENILLPARCLGTAPSKTRAADLMARLRIADLAHQRADRISHGQAQRVAIARALFSDPTLILCDEPTSALDDKSAAAMLGLLRFAGSIANAATLITTHDARILGAVDAVYRLETHIR